MNLREILQNEIHGLPIEAPASGQDGYTLAYNETLNKYEWVMTVGAHTHVELDITDLDHYDSADFAIDFAAEDLANLATKSYNDLTDKPDLSALHSHPNKSEIDLVSDGDHDVRVDNPHNILSNQVSFSASGFAAANVLDAIIELDTEKADDVHTHLEADITDLNHSAIEIQGIPVDIPASGQDGYVLTYNESLNKYEWTASAMDGDMLKAVYDIDDDGIVDKAEALNDGSSGGGNNVTALEARTHIDDITGNPHNITAEMLQVWKRFWLQTFVLNTPSTVTRAFGQSAEGLNPGFDIRIMSLKVQYLSEHPTQSVLRIRVFKYDATATTDYEILSILISGTTAGYHNIEDNTPDTLNYDLDASAGDRIWIEVDDGAGASANRVSEITISVSYELI